MRDTNRASRLSLAADVEIDWAPIRDLLPDWEGAHFATLFEQEADISPPTLFGAMDDGSDDDEDEDEYLDGE